MIGGERYFLNVCLGPSEASFFFFSGFSLAMCLIGLYCRHDQNSFLTVHLHSLPGCEIQAYHLIDYI